MSKVEAWAVPVDGDIGFGMKFLDCKFENSGVSGWLDRWVETQTFGDDDCQLGIRIAQVAGGRSSLGAGLG